MFQVSARRPLSAALQLRRDWTARFDGMSFLQRAIAVNSCLSVSTRRKKPTIVSATLRVRNVASVGSTTTRATLPPTPRNACVKSARSGAAFCSFRPHSGPAQSLPRPRALHGRTAMFVRECLGWCDARSWGSWARTCGLGCGSRAQPLQRVFDLRCGWRFRVGADPRDQRGVHLCRHTRWSWWPT